MYDKINKQKLKHLHANLSYKKPKKMRPMKTKKEAKNAYDDKSTNEQTEESNAKDFQEFLQNGNF